jgi:hypothetical protein
MRLIIFIVFTVSVVFSSMAFGATTIFFKDGTKEVGNSAWIEGNSVFLSKSKEIYEFSADEVLLEETQKFNRIGKFADGAASNPKDADRTGSSDLVEQLMAGSSIDRQIDQFIQQFSAGALSSARSNSEVREIFTEALAGFDPQKAKQRVRAYYRTHLDTKTLETIVVWTTSPLGIKVRSAETGMAAMTPERAQQLLKSLEENPLPPQRMAFIQEIDKAGRITEMSLRLITDAIFGAMEAVPGGTPENKQAREQIERQAERQKAELEPLVRKQVQAGLTNTYKDLTDSELKEYGVFLDAEPARTFTTATMEALSEMTKTMSASMIRHILKAVEQKRGGQEQ